MCIVSSGGNSKGGPEKIQAATGPVPPALAGPLLVPEDTDTEPWHVPGETENSRCVEKLSPDLPLQSPFISPQQCFEEAAQRFWQDGEPQETSILKPGVEGIRKAPRPPLPCLPLSFLVFFSEDYISGCLWVGLMRGKWLDAPRGATCRV